MKRVLVYFKDEKDERACKKQAKALGLSTSQYLVSCWRAQQGVPVMAQPVADRVAAIEKASLRLFSQLRALSEDDAADVRVAEQNLTEILSGAQKTYTLEEARKILSGEDQDPNKNP